MKHFLTHCSYYRFLLMFLLLTLGVETFSQELIVYNVPKQLFYSAHNDDFTVQVRQPGKAWQDLFEYKVQVDLDKPQDASMVYFDFSGEVEVRIQKNNGQVRTVDIRPFSKKVKANVEQNEIRFTLKQPTKLSIEINGDRLHNLHLFANEIPTENPDKEDPEVMYFEAGFHKPDSSGVFRIPSGKTVFIDGGAVLNGKLLVDKASDVKIIGHGIIWHPHRGVEICNSKNVMVDGPIFVNPKHYTIFGGQVKGLTVRNIKTFSSRGWADGIDLMSCSDVQIDDVFVRTSDDCIALYGHRWEYFGNARNIEVKNSILWADIAHPTNIGTHGNAKAGGDTIENVRFYNIDILQHDEDDRNYQGCMAISNTDNNLVRNITYENIRIEAIQEGQIFNFRSLFNEKYSGAPGRSVENILVKNVSFTGGFVNPSTIGGYSKDRCVKGIKFENIQINGIPLSLRNPAHVTVQDFVFKLKSE